jgi:hypothetical protein
MHHFASLLPMVKDLSPLAKTESVIKSIADTFLQDGFLQNNCTLHCVEGARFQGYYHCVSVHQHTYTGIPPERNTRSLMLGIFKERREAVSTLANHLTTDEFGYVSTQAWRNMTRKMIGRNDEELLGSMAATVPQFGHCVLLWWYNNVFLPQTASVTIKQAALEISEMFEALLYVDSEVIRHGITLGYLKVNTAEYATDKIVLV